MSDRPLLVARGLRRTFVSGPERLHILRAIDLTVRPGERIAIDLKVGDRVLFSKYGGTDVKLDGEDYLIMREDDILGVIEG